MCGLTSFLGSTTRAPADAEDRIGAMTACLHYRCPDVQGIWIGEGIAQGRQTPAGDTEAPAHALRKARGGPGDRPPRRAVDFLSEKVAEY